MLGETPDYDKLSNQSGIDFNALKEKYAAKSATSTSTQGAADLLTDAMMSEQMQRQQEARIANEVLDKYRTCDMCHGTGIQKYIYNFMSMESNCDTCEGEGLLIRKKTEPTAAYTDNKKDTELDNDDDACSVDPTIIAAVVGNDTVASALGSKKPENSESETSSMETPD